MSAPKSEADLQTMQCSTSLAHEQQNHKSYHGITRKYHSNHVSTLLLKWLTLTDISTQPQKNPISAASTLLLVNWPITSLRKDY